MTTLHLVAVIQDRTLEVVSDGTEAGTTFTGDERDIRKATAVASRGLSVPVGMGRPGGVPLVQAGFDSAMGLAAALASIAPQYVYFRKAPAEVLDYYDEQFSSKGCLARTERNKP